VQVLAGQRVITHEFLRIMLAVRRSGVTLAVQILEGKGLIRATRGTIRIVDRAGLVQHTEGAYGKAEREYERSWASGRPMENEAHLVFEEFGADHFDIVFPPTSIRAEPPVAVVDKNAQAHGTTELATAYLQYLYTAEGQAIAARHHYRPSKPDLVEDKSLLEGFPQMELISIDDPLFGGWAAAQPKHFGDGGIFDQIYAP
jgi:hypothetical protein